MKRCLKPKGLWPWFTPCKVCIVCVERYQWEWSQRLLAAYYAHKRTHFVTLTFNPAMSGKYAHIQKWLKRCRRSRLDFKYACVAEPHKRLVKGKQRWHYHLLMFTNSQYPSDKLRHHWKGGISHARLSSTDDIEYTVKYLHKTSNHPRASNGLAKSIFHKVAQHPLVAAALTAFPDASIGTITQNHWYKDQWGDPAYKELKFHPAKAKKRGGAGDTSPEYDYFKKVIKEYDMLPDLNGRREKG